MESLVDHIMQKLLFILLLTLPLVAQAQTEKEKNLQQMIQEVASGKLSDEEMFRKLSYIQSDYYYFRDFEKALHYCRKGVSLAREKKNVKEESYFLTKIGFLYIELDASDSVLFYLDKSLKLIEGKGFYEEEYRNYEVRGNFFSVINDYENQMDACLKAIEVVQKDKAQKIANKQSIELPLREEMQMLNNIAIIYNVTCNTDKTIEYLLKAMKVMDDNPEVDFGIFKYYLLGNLADMYISVNQLDKAFPLIEKAYKLVAATDDFESIAYQLVRSSKFYLSSGDLKQALNYGKQALQMAEKANIPGILNVADKNLVQLYLTMKDYKSSLYYANRILERTREDDWHMLHNIYENLALIYAATGNIEKANEYMSKYRDVTTAISDKNMHEVIQEMEIKYNVKQKELEIMCHQDTIKQQRSIFIAGMGVALLIIGFMIYISIQRKRCNRMLAEMNALKDKFFSIISHDLKNPTIAQRDALQLLADNADQLDSHLLSEYYQKLLKSANGMVALLNNLLNWTQIQTKQEIYRPVTFNIVAALQSDVEVIRNMAASKHLAFKAVLPPTAIITGDENMLVTVVRNLLSNAVKFTADGGGVILEISPCSGEVACNAPTTYTVSVTDTGVGMSEEQVRNLFRLDGVHSNRGTAGETGTGLGLIVCKEMLEKHGIILHIESTEGKGSKFWFEV